MRLCLSVFLGLLLAVPCHAYTVTEQQTLKSGLYNLYSPTHSSGVTVSVTVPLIYAWGPQASFWTYFLPAQEHILIGGWSSVTALEDFLALLAGDSRKAGDTLYRTVKQYGTWGPLREVLRLPGCHINDADMVTAPNNPQVLYAYVTVACHPDWQNRVGLAVSVNGGRSWEYQDRVIDERNDLIVDGAHCLAWSPSALVVGHEVWVVSFANHNCHLWPQVHVFAANGATLLRKQFLSTEILLLNHDIARTPDGTWLMTGNGGARWDHIPLLVSPDGLTWTVSPALPDGRLYEVDSAHFALTPAFANVTAHGFDVLYTTGQELSPFVWKTGTFELVRLHVEVQ